MLEIKAGQISDEQVSRLLQRATSESLEAQIAVSMRIGLSSGPLSLSGIPWDGMIYLLTSVSTISTIGNRITDQKTCSYFHDGCTTTSTPEQLSDVPTLESICHRLAMSVVSDLEGQLMKYLSDLVANPDSPK
jgi:hypothetical protein